MTFKEKYEHDTYKEFHIPLNENDITLKEAMEIMKKTASEDYKVPLIIRLIENPEWNIPYIDLFHGAVDLYTHDCIHLILGRGMLPKDEAFVIGFTMGSTNKVNMFEKMLFKFITKYIYRKPWNFSNDDLLILDLAISLGHISNCAPLDKVNFKVLEDMKLGEIRKNLGIEIDMLEKAYELEKVMYARKKEFEIEKLKNKHKESERNI